MVMEDSRDDSRMGKFQLSESDDVTEPRPEKTMLLKLPILLPDCMSEKDISSISDPPWPDLGITVFHEKDCCCCCSLCGEYPSLPAGV